MPGQPGNMALAGHRVGKGSPFLDLDQLRPGDPIVVETADTWFVYRVMGDPGDRRPDRRPVRHPGQEIVRPTDVSVLPPTPDGPDDAAAHRGVPDPDHVPSEVLRPAAAGDPRGARRRPDRQGRGSRRPARAERGDLMYSWIWRHLPGGTAVRTARHWSSCWPWSPCCCSSSSRGSSRTCPSRT